MSEQKRNWGKELKDVGMLVILVSAVVLVLAIYSFFGGNEVATLMFGKSFLPMVILGLVGIVAGMVIRNIGKSKMEKAETNNQK